MATSEAPPSYDAVVKDIQAKLATAPSDLKHATQVLQAVPEKDIKLLVDNIPEKPLALTKEQQESIASGMATALSSTAGMEYIKTSASRATAAVNAIELMFSNCLRELSSIDSTWPKEKPAEGAFAPRLQKIQTEYRGIVHDSRMLAVDIAHYGTRFGGLIIPIVNDKDVGLDIKKKKLQEFIDDASKFELKSGQINTRFQGVKATMDIFAGTFKSWASSRGGEIDKKIDDLRKDIEDLNKEIRDKRTAMLVLGGIAVASLPIAATVAAFTGPAAPVVLLVGIIVAGVTTATAIGLAFAIKSLQAQVDNKNTEINKLKKEKDDIAATRAKLDLLAKQDLSKFKENIDVLASFWTSAAADARKIQGHLNDGKGVAELPKYLKQEMEKAQNIYEILAQYLTEYAKGIDSSEIPKQ